MKMSKAEKDMNKLPDHVRKIMVAIPQTGSYPREFMESYTHMKNYLLSPDIYALVPFDFVLVEYFCHTFPIDANRNECIAFALEYNFDQVIFLDCDQEFGRDTLLKLLVPDKPILAGMYYAKAEPYFPICFKESPDSKDFNIFHPIYQHPAKEHFYADMIGMGCFAMKREVFEKMEMPYCKYQPHPEHFKGKDFVRDLKIEYGISDVSEDVWFWKQVKGLGYKIQIDPTINVLHLAQLKVGRELSSMYQEGIKQGVIENKGEEHWERMKADACRAEAIKSAS